MNATGQTFEDQVVYLDGSSFYNCQFRRCVLVYSGLMPVTMVGCEFVNSTFDFAGPAANTLQFLYSLGNVGGDGTKVVEDVLRPILDGRDHDK